MLKLPKRGGNLRVTGCLPFTCTNHLVHGVGKWFTKLRTGKFRPRIACTICTNQFHLDGREDLKLVSKMALKEWNTNFRLEYSIQKNRTTFSDVPVARELKKLTPTLRTTHWPHSADYPLTPLRGLLYGLLRGLLYGLVRGLPCGLP